MNIPKELKKKKILVVDDAASSRNMTRSILRDVGFVFVYDAQDGEEAYKLIKRLKIDLVICDWVMPVMSGLDLFKVVKDDADLQYIAFIMLTASSETDKVKEALQAGITDYIIKPYTTDVLLKNVLNRLG